MEYAGKKIREEAPEAADGYRRAFAEGIEKYIAFQNQVCKAERSAFMKGDREDIRERYKKLLGLDAFTEKSTRPAELQYTGSDDVCRIYRLAVYIGDQIPFYSLLLIPHEAKSPMPLVITQHGGGGTPELCSDMNGKNNYNHMVQRVLARGAAALAPQLMLWAREGKETAPGHPIAYDRQKTDRDLKRFGTGITALEIAGIQRSLDYVSNLDCIDQERIAMIGLSYGGYFTLYTMAADTRIKAGYSAGAFNDRDTHCFADWAYTGAACCFQDAEVAALCAPRKLYVQVGKTDPVFDYQSAVPEAERAAGYYAAQGCPENFQFDLWDGGHTVSTDDAGYDFLFSAIEEKE